MPAPQRALPAAALSRRPCPPCAHSRPASSSRSLWNQKCVQGTRKTVIGTLSVIISAVMFEPHCVSAQCICSSLRGAPHLFVSQSQQDGVRQCARTVHATLEAKGSEEEEVPTLFAPSSSGAERTSPVLRAALLPNAASSAPTSMGSPRGVPVPCTAT